MGDFHRVPFSDESFGGVLLWDYLQMAISPYIVLKEAHRVLAPGGRMLVYMPSEIGAPYHYSLLNPRQMTWLLTKAGFELVSMDREEGIYKVDK